MSEDEEEWQIAPFETIENTCFGEYGQHESCPTCHLKEPCKKFTKAEEEVTLRHKGKYGFKGKEKKKDKY